MTTKQIPLRLSSFLEIIVVREFSASSTGVFFLLQERKFFYKKVFFLLLQVFSFFYKRIFCFFYRWRDEMESELERGQRI